MNLSSFKNIDDIPIIKGNTDVILKIYYFDKYFRLYPDK